jgi:hypothetical protein
MKTAFTALLLLAALLTTTWPAAADPQPLTAWWIDSGDTDSTAIWVANALLVTLMGMDSTILPFPPVVFGAIQM